MDFELSGLIDDDVEILEILEVGVPRQIYERNEYFYTFDDLSFYKRFRLTKEITLLILNRIESSLECPSNRNNSIAPINPPPIIKFPETATDISKTKRDIFDKASFPNVIAAIDGTHVKIQSPGGTDGEIFRNRKSYFSINVQAICNAKMIFSNVVARWTVSTHDATIFSNCRIKNVLEIQSNANAECFLLGDLAYPQKSYLMTPLLNRRSSAEQLYNESEIRSRGVIEKTFGILKRRFPVLAYGARLKLSTVLTIIIATCTLHNILRENGICDDPPESFDFSEEDLQRVITDGQIHI